MEVLKLILKQVKKDWWALYQSKLGTILEHLLLFVIAYFAFFPNIISLDEISTELRITVALVGSAILLAILRLVFYLIVAPFKVIRNQSKELAKLSGEGIEINGYYPKRDRIGKPGLIVENKKDFTLKNCTCRLVSFQQGDELLNIPKLPPLLWVVDSKLRGGELEIEPKEKRLVALQAWEEPKSGFVEINVYQDDAELYGGVALKTDRHIALEFGGKYGLGIHKGIYYKAGFCIDCVVDGHRVTSSTFYFQLRNEKQVLRIKRVRS